MTRITVRNKSSVPVRWGGHTFPPRADKIVDVDDAKIARIESQRRLRVVSVGPGTGDGEPLWGSTVADAKAYVGDDGARALVVLDAENERGDKARSSLVVWLEDVISDSPTDDESAGKEV